MAAAHTFSATVYIPEGADWYFVTLPKKLSDTVRKGSRKKTAYGMIPVKATIGKTAWSTSLFPTKGGDNLVMALKAEVRKKEHIGRGDRIKVSFTLV